MVSHLRHAILTGALAPGVLLRETELALQIGVSATPVREALSELANEGLVEIEPNRLKRVTPLDPRAMFDLLRVQIAIWRLAYDLAFSAIGGRVSAPLRVITAEIAQSIGASNNLAAMNAVDAFHTIMIEASGSPEAIRLTRDRRTLIARFVILSIGALVNRETVLNHERLLATLECGDQRGFMTTFDGMTGNLLAYLTDAAQI